MPERIRRKWCPPLALILGSTLAVVLCLPLAGIMAVRYLAPALGYREAVAAVGVGVVFVAAAVGWTLWRVLLRPIRSLVGRAEGVTHGMPAALDPLAHYGTREMEHLGQAVLDMGRVLLGREAVLRSYAEHATHELKSPLTVLRGAAELLDNPDLDAADRARLLARIDGAAERMTALLDAQRALAGAQDLLVAGQARLADVLAAVQADLVRTHRGLDITVAADAPLPLGAEGLRMVLGHLLANAAQMGAERVWLRAGADRLDVIDDGPGVSEGNRDRIFDPFFTTRRDAGGTGMGLSILRRMLDAHGATILLEPGGASPVRLASGMHGAHFSVMFR